MLVAVAEILFPATEARAKLDLWEDFAKNELRSDSLGANFLYVGNSELLPRNRRSIIVFPF